MFVTQNQQNCVKVKIDQFVQLDISRHFGSSVRSVVRQSGVQILSRIYNLVSQV